jgi:Prophage protein (DUF1660)
MSKLPCALLGHKWTPAEATNEPGLKVVCQRCGLTRSLEEGTTVRERKQQDIAVGQIWNGGLFGGNKMAIVAIEGDTIYAKRADSPTKNLRLGKGAAYPTHRSEFASMTLLDERWALDEEE